MKKFFVLLVLVIFMVGCRSSKNVFDEDDVSEMVYVGTQVFETQEIAEFKLTEMGIPYVVMDAGTTSYEYQLATIDSEYKNPKNAKSGFYVNEGETIVLKIHTYEPEEKAPKEEVPKVEKPPKKEQPSDNKSSGYKEIYDKWSAEIIKKAPDVGMSELAEIANEGVLEMANYMFEAKGKDGQYETYEEWAGKLMDVYMKEAR